MLDETGDHKSALERSLKGANELLLELLLGAVDEKQLVRWAGEMLTSVDPLSCCPEIISIAELSGIDVERWDQRPTTLLKEVVREFYADFAVPSMETEKYAKACLREKSAGFLLGTLTQSAFFTVINNIHRLFKNPAWLGELYHLSCKSRSYANEKVFHSDLISELKARLTEL